MTKSLQTRKGILLLLLATFTFTAMDAVAKGLVASYPVPQVVWARFLGQCILVSIYLAPGGLLQHLRTRHPGLHLARSGFQLGATTFFFLSLAYIGLAEATAIADIAPVLITLGAALFLGERLTLQRLLAVLAALVGSLVIIRPGLGVFSAAAFLPLLCAASYAANALLTRHLGLREGPWTSLLHAAIFGTVVTSLALPMVWVPIAPSDLPLFVLIGFLGSLAQFLIIRAYSLAEASAITPFSYAGILFASFWGFTLYAELPDLWTAIGALVIAGSGLYVWHHETQQDKNRG